jgi:hypothetical protein
MLTEVLDGLKVVAETIDSVAKIMAAAQYPAYAHPCQRFADPLADISA